MNNGVIDFLGCVVIGLAAFACVFTIVVIPSALIYSVVVESDPETTVIIDTGEEVLWYHDCVYGVLRDKYGVTILDINNRPIACRIEEVE